MPGDGLDGEAVTRVSVLLDGLVDADDDGPVVGRADLDLHEVDALGSVDGLLLDAPRRVNKLDLHERRSPQMKAFGLTSRVVVKVLRLRR